MAEADGVLDYLAARRIAAAMIELAIWDWRAGIQHSPQSRHGRLSRDAADWLFNPKRQASVTLDMACALVGLDVAALRAGIVGRTRTPRAGRAAELT